MNEIPKETADIEARKKNLALLDELEKKTKEAKANAEKERAIKENADNAKLERIKKEAAIAARKNEIPKDVFKEPVFQKETEETEVKTKDPEEKLLSDANLLTPVKHKGQFLC
jgi:hypothetical protein